MKIWRDYKYYKQYSKQDLILGYKSMANELLNISNTEINMLFLKAWKDFKENKWSYDGATFVKERYSTTIFEVAAFIHDWRNSNGYVGTEIDNELLDIMITLHYPSNKIAYRYLWTRLTPLNILRHKLFKNYISKTPKDLYKL